MGDDAQRMLEPRAAIISVAEYLRQQIERTASRPTPQELAARIEARGRVRLQEPGAVTVRHLRGRGEE